MEPVWIFGTLVSIIFGAVGFLVRLVYGKIVELERKVAEMDKMLVKVMTIMDEIEKR